MGNTIKCCVACMLPCGALDVVRVLHANGRVDEYSRTVTAGEVMKANPKHVLGQPTCQGLVQRTAVLPPDAELQRGKIYFLIPAYALQRHKEPRFGSNSKPSSLQTPSVKRVSEKRVQKKQKPLQSPPNANANQSDPEQPPFRIKQCGSVTKLVISEQYLSEVLSEKSTKAEQHDRQCRRNRKKPECSRMNRFGVWRPVLESISEVEPL